MDKEGKFIDETEMYFGLDACLYRIISIIMLADFI